MLNTMERNASDEWGAWLDEVSPGTRDKLQTVIPPVQKPSPVLKEPSTTPIPTTCVVRKQTPSVEKPATPPARKQTPLAQKAPAITTPAIQKTPAITTPAVQKTPAITIPAVQKPSPRVSRSHSHPQRRVNGTVHDAVDAWAEESKISDDDEQDQDHAPTSEEEGEGGEDDDNSVDDGAPLQDESEESEGEFPPVVPDTLPTDLPMVELLSLYNHKTKMRMWVEAQKEQGMPRVSHPPSLLSPSY